MADSDNSTTLASVTRRRLMTGAAAIGVSAREHPLGHLKQDDPALSLCKSWLKIHNRTWALYRKQQRLEAYLTRTVGDPCVKVRLRDGEEVTLHTAESLNEVVAREGEACWSKAIRELESQQARWDAADCEVGYSKTQDLERRSELAEQALLDELPRTPAFSIEGALAKLSVILRNGEHWEDPHAFPWPHLRSVLNDLARLHRIDPVAIAGNKRQQDERLMSGRSILG